MQARDALLTKALRETEIQWRLTQRKSDFFEIVMKIFQLVRPIFYFLDLVFVGPLHALYRNLQNEIDSIEAREAHKGDFLDMTREVAKEFVDITRDVFYETERAIEMTCSPCYPLSASIGSLAVVTVISLVALKVLVSLPPFYVIYT